jgi:hypothetical protein
MRWAEQVAHMVDIRKTYIRFQPKNNEERNANIPTKMLK